MRTALRLTTATLLFALAATATSAASAPAYEILPGTISVASITPEPLAAPGDAQLRLRIYGRSDRTTITGFSFEATQVAAATGLSADSVEVGSVTLDGPGELVGLPTVATDIAPPAPCLRAGYPVPIQYAAHQYVLRLPPDTSTELVVGVHVPEGFVDAAARLVVRATEPGEDAPVGQPLVLATLPRYAAARTLVIPRTGPAHELVTVASGAMRRGRVKLIGRITPPRAGAAIEFVGRRTRRGPDDVLGAQAAATTPVGRTLHRYGRTTATARGTFSAWVKVPRGAVVVARTAGVPGSVLGGQSCPIQSARAETASGL